MVENLPLPDLTKAEFDILRIIWKSGKLSVREVHDQIIATHNWAYSTTKTMMDRMAGKQLLTRGKYHGVFLYRPLISRPKGFARFIQFFADRVLELDYGEVVALFSRSKALDPEEIQELERLLVDDMEDDRHDTS
ncbi:MAG: BlaI/MecI/CopY family transcriptional regulator [Deltaproteobacteria bacterium]|uniref:BlaI/MecI/CopY family transcriptional regulator n=1 Tax=Desulfobacula sp. TaxID=2593537 RepID=UPI00199446C5|nr:BlaI/MecI/CopY family transcriptional regulator [Candidatus Desulfobacula maris]MBL6995552.1 BlaI/MecI/CopY family transcriptional regulator [Desulfobacula sp.]